MAEYNAVVQWQRGDQVFTDNRYSRGHEWQFDGGVTVPASSSPHIVPLPYSVEQNVDPEEAFVAALSSCHMLFFLSYAAQAGFCVDQYTDMAIGTMGADNTGKTVMTSVVLKPDVQFVGKQPDMSQLRALHDKAHHSCFLANSVNFPVETELSSE
ncbi:OsmC family protein [Oceanospirillum sediminis]|uniref:OsmC family protein n=1 Tax=Oceanospirillum sediminis TaxID=2760088 RepID=A0A839IQI4_9GAMM|nr:OsmC family protein [Oceanospirillum sediminis]MBB1487191.1 OsmC family protein [Oceanospirillum sediminis]